MSRSDQVIKAVNALTIKIIDSSVGFEVAANQSHGFAFYAEFEHEAIERRMIGKRLQKLVSELGGEPECTGSFFGATKRFIRHYVHAAVGDLAIVRLVDREEAHILDEFVHFLKDSNLSSPVRAEILACFSSFREGFQRVQLLEHQLTTRARPKALSSYAPPDDPPLEDAQRDIVPISMALNLAYSRRAKSRHVARSHWNYRTLT